MIEPRVAWECPFSHLRKGEGTGSWRTRTLPSPIEKFPEPPIPILTPPVKAVPSLLNLTAPPSRPTRTPPVKEHPVEPATEAPAGQAALGSETARIPRHFLIRQSTRAVSIDAERLRLTNVDSTGGEVVPLQFAPAP